MAVTIKQIAERAGLSVPTVSRILNNDGELFRPETRDKVLTAARDLGYRPNSYRMALRTKRFNAIGLLFTADPTLTGLSCDTQCALLRALQRRNQHLVAGQASSDDSTGEAALPKMLREWSVDGLLIDTAAAAPLEVEQLIRRTAIPSIWLNTKRDVDCVYADEEQGAAHGTRELLSLGHKRVMYLDLGDRGHASPPARRAGYEAAMQSAGLPPRHLIPEPLDDAHRVAFVSKWLASVSAADRPTAILCAAATHAMPLYIAAMKAGLSVPEDLSILTIHDQASCGLGVQLTMMRLPSAELAGEGLTALDQKIAHPHMELPPQAVQLIFEKGTTIAHAKA